MWSLVSALFLFLKSAGDIVSKAFDYFTRKQAIEEGKTIEKAELAVKDQEIEDEQNKILIEDRPKEDVIKKLEDGEF